MEPALRPFQLFIAFTAPLTTLEELGPDFFLASYPSDPAKGACYTFTLAVPLALYHAEKTLTPLQTNH